jgi:pentatricopeptide repeat protein
VDNPGIPSWKSGLHMNIKIKKYMIGNLSRQPVFLHPGNGGWIMNWVYMKGISIDAQYLYHKAMELLKQERYETALRYFRQATVISPGYAKAFSAMASCHVNLGRFDDAIRLYNRAIEIDPACDEAQVQRDMIIHVRELLKVNPRQFMGILS